MTIAHGTRLHVFDPTEPDVDWVRATRLRTDRHASIHSGRPKAVEGLLAGLSEAFGTEVVAMGQEGTGARRCFHVSSLYRVTTSDLLPAMVRVSLGMHDTPDECGGEVEFLHTSGWVHLFRCPPVDWFYDVPAEGEERILDALQSRADAYAIEASGIL
jgi:hypothetical protein